MTQEDKELLLKDICGRLPYGVKVEIYKDESPYKLKGYDGKDFLSDSGWDYLIEQCKPYLFPLSSMTEEQKKEYNRLRDLVPTYHYEYGDIVEDTELYDNWGSIDYLIANHFDYRGLIPMGLANDATGLNIY